MSSDPNTFPLPVQDCPNFLLINLCTSWFTNFPFIQPYLSHLFHSWTPQNTPSIFSTSFLQSLVLFSLICGTSFPVQSLSLDNSWWSACWMCSFFRPEAPPDITLPIYPGLKFFDPCPCRDRCFVEFWWTLAFLDIHFTVYPEQLQRLDYYLVLFSNHFMFGWHIFCYLNPFKLNPGSA